MYCLVKLIKNGVTVIYESAESGQYYVFKEHGSYSRASPAVEANVPELKSSTTVHWFDCKAGAAHAEPNSSRAKLIATTSANDHILKQARRRLTCPFHQPARMSFIKLVRE